MRKHVERSGADSRRLLTTYEGSHSHDKPAPLTGARFCRRRCHRRCCSKFSTPARPLSARLASRREQHHPSLSKTVFGGESCDLSEAD